MDWGGFEPPLTACKAVVLPLHRQPVGGDALIRTGTAGLERRDAFRYTTSPLAYHFNLTG